MTRFVAVVDLGKTNSKVVLVDTRAAVEVQVITQAAAVSSNTIYPSIDHHSIKLFIFDSLVKLSSRYPIDAITVTTHGATAALVDGAGELALPVLDYEYQLIDELRTNYEKVRSAFSNTGSPRLPGGLNIGAQLFWQKYNFPTQFMQTVSILTWPQYWIHLLTGNRHNDVTSLGCHTDLYEPHNKRYSGLVLDMDWLKLMPAIKNSGQLSGSLNATLAKHLGLSRSLPVYTGIHDSNASLVPHLIAHKSPFTVVSTGTWFIVMAVNGVSVELDESRDMLLNVNARGEPVTSSRFMGGRERDLLKVSSQNSEKSLDALLRNDVAPSMLMPSPVSGTGPYPTAVPCWIGTPVDSSGVRDSVISLYLALMTYECMQLAGSDGAIFLEGPLARDQQFAQMLMAVSGRPVMFSNAQTGTSVGAAMLISPPVETPTYQQLSLSSRRREKMQNYATLWQQQLLDHTK